MPASCQILDRLLTAVGKATRLVGLIERARGSAALEESQRPRHAQTDVSVRPICRLTLAPATAWQPRAYARGGLSPSARGRHMAIDSRFSS